MTSDVTGQLLRLINLPDLILIAIVLVNMLLGFRRGLLGSFCGLAGRIAALAAAYFAARAAAPAAAQWVVLPIVGDVFERRAALGVSSGVLDGLRQTVTEAAVSMAESIAFLLLAHSVYHPVRLAGRLLVKSLHFVAHATPIGILIRSRAARSALRRA